MDKAGLRTIQQPLKDTYRGSPEQAMTGAHLTAALDQLLDARGQLTRTLLSGRGTAGQDAVIRRWERTR